MSTPAPAPSAPALVYLFADRVVESGTALGKKLTVPCTKATVKRDALASHIFAIAFWSLQEQGKIELAIGKRTMLGAGHPQITASLRPGVEIRTPPAGPQLPPQVDIDQLKQANNPAEIFQNLVQQGLIPQGMIPQGVMQQPVMQQAPTPPASAPEPEAPPFTLEDATLHQLQVLGGSAPIRDVVRGWFVPGHADPHGTVIDRVARELGELGYATMAGGGIPSRPTVTVGKFKSSPTVTVDCDRRAAIEASAVEILDRWRVFQEAPDGLGSNLVWRCGDAISSETDNQGKGFDMQPDVNI